MRFFRSFCWQWIASFLLATTVPLFSEADRTDVVRTRTRADLVNLAEAVRIYYGPIKWKAEELGWVLEVQLQKALNKVELAHTLEVNEAREILTDFLASLNDYHVGMSFSSTESASLPFRIRGTENNYFIVAIDREKVAFSEFPANLGDEVIEFNGQPIADVIAALAQKIGGSNSSSNMRLAETKLTHRLGRLGEFCPQGNAILRIRNSEGDERQITLPWRHEREKIPLFPELLAEPTVAKMQIFGNNRSTNDFLDPIRQKVRQFSHFPSPLALDILSFADKRTPSAYDMGSRNGFLPPLGPITWISDEKEQFFAYTFISPSGRSIGYVRVPTYLPRKSNKNDASTEEKAALQFQRLIAKMESETDMLIYDQTANGGGSLLYTYALLSHLTDTPLVAPNLTVRLNVPTVLDAIETEALMNAASANLSEASSASIDGYPLTLSVIRGLQGFFQAFIEDWHQGELFSRSLPLLNLKTIVPNPKTHYTKPILCLIDELDMSCADLAPAILQDNNRAILMGTRTGGAGGAIEEHSINSHLGMHTVRLTTSLLERSNGEKIEDRGVLPDVPYTLTARDLKERCADYHLAILMQIEKMLQP